MNNLIFYKSNYKELESGYFNITIIKNKNNLFCQEVKEALDLLYSQKNGRSLINLLSRRNSCIYIVEGSQDSTCAKLNIISLHFCSQNSIGKDGKNIPFPFFIKLAHELIHIAQKDDQKLVCFKDEIHQKIWTNEKEYCVIEAGSNQHPDLTENAIRREHNLLERATHLAPINLPQEWREEIKNCGLHSG